MKPISMSPRIRARPGPLAQVIRDMIFRKTKLTASAGIGPNKLIAKIASEHEKAKRTIRSKTG